MVGNSAMIYGTKDDLEGKDIIIYDDIIDTFGSLEKTCRVLREQYHCRTITVAATHGVFSFPGRDNLINALYPNGAQDQVIDRVILTDSLPTPRYAFDGVGGVTVLPVGQLLGGLAHIFADFSQKEMLRDSYIRQYVLDPIDKEQMWEYFNAVYADPNRLPKD